MKSPMPLAFAAAALLLSAASDGTTEEAKAKCPVTGNPSNPDLTTEYEKISYAFCSEKCVKTFQEERAASLYEKVGGRAAIDAAVELFYVKVLADERVNFFFEDIVMNKQKRQQKAFLSAALGSPVAWTGKDMRKAHANLDLKESDFAAIAENLQATLVELELDAELIGQIMAVVASTKDDVLNR
ncbi:MAG: group 1 truncated hemoglobin [Verrucomicrobiales bacterium]